jgi:DNA-binding transcriptional regulator YdaS (Cro superfamily)
MHLANDMREALNEAIAKAGGIVTLSRKIGVSHQAVSRMMAVGRASSRPSTLMAIERVTGVPRERLRPDVYYQTEKERM